MEKTNPSRQELEKIWGKTKLIGGEKLEVEVGKFYCFQCHGYIPVRLSEKFPSDEPLQPKRTWCGTCGSLIGTYYTIPKELRTKEIDEDVLKIAIGLAIGDATELLLKKIKENING